MNKENIPVITDIEKLYDECKNMEQLFYKYYLPLLDKHYSKTYELQQENQELKKKYENKYSRIGTLTNEVLYEENTKLINQQKEFISYLEDLIRQNETVVEVSKYGLPKNCSKLLIDFYKEILSKYKEITGQHDGQVSGQV